MRYANQAAADLLGCATPEELLAKPLGTIFAQWESTHEDGRPMVAEDVPSYKIVNGQPAEPLLTRIVNRETGEQRWRLVKAAPLRGAGGETMAVSVIEDVTEAKEAELRQRFLAQAGATLTSSLDYEETLQRVAQLVVPGLADWCAVDVVDANGRLNLVAVAHVDPEQGRLRARAAQAATRRTPTRTRGIYGVLRSGRPELYPELPDELLAQSIEDPEQLATIRALGMRSVMLIPMDVAGRTIGVLTMVSAESGRSFTEDDLVFAGDLARRAATAVENARLYTERAAAALTLQESLLPARLPTMPGWALASSYAAGDTTVDVGGDFFDVVELDEGFLAIVGDVTGKGVQAAALTALARHTLATAARFDPSPAAVVEPAQRRPRPPPGDLAADRRVRPCGADRSRRPPAPDERRPSAPGPVAARAAPDDDRPARAAAGDDRRGALGAERDRVAPATRCSSTPTASPTRRRAASASARSGCSTPCPTHRPSRAR